MMTLVHTLAVAEYLNFRHAANALGVAQSSVSARVKALEEDLGIVLFERHARGVRLTEAGRHFVERIAAGIDQLDHAVKTAGMAAAGESGRLRIGIHALIHSTYDRGCMAPVVLWYRGDLEQLRKPILTIAGSSHPDAESLDNADMFGEALGRQSKVLLSTGFGSETEVAFASALIRQSQSSMLFGCRVAWIGMAVFC